MPLIKKPTVLILGAGASYPYGYPLGSELVDKVIGECGSVSDPEFQSWLKHANCPVEHIVRIRNAMETADPYSVDAFLESQKLEIQQAGKVAIALTLLRFEEDGGTGSQRLNPRRYSEKFHRNVNPLEAARAEDHWYQYLAHFLSSGVSKGQFADHKLSIVTFNYDRSLEEYLYRVLGARYDCDAHDLVKTIPVVHLHGDLGPLEWESPGGRQYGGPFDMKAVLPVAAGRLNIVSDEIPKDDKAFTTAREKLSEAKYVGFLGFGYHEASLHRLQFRDLTRTAVRFGTRKGLRAAEWATAERLLGQPKVNVKCESNESVDLADVGCLGFLRRSGLLHLAAMLHH